VIERARARRKSVGAGAITSAARLCRSVFGWGFIGKFLVRFVALAVATLGGAVAGKAQGPIRINLPVTSITGFPEVFVGEFGEDSNQMFINEPGTFLVTVSDERAAANALVIVKASPVPSLDLSAAEGANGVTLKSASERYNYSTRW
jgi:hypothetical protein